MRRWLLTAGRDATVRVWDVDEAMRSGESAYMCPWALATDR